MPFTKTDSPAPSMSIMETRESTKPWQDKATLKWVYSERGLSGYKASKVLGISPASVYHWLDKHGIERRSPGGYTERDGTKSKRQGFGTVCPECGREDFETERAMRIHYGRSHDGDLPFVDVLDGVACPTCDTEFRTDRAMKIHHKKVHDVTLAKVEAECAYCGGSVTKRPLKGEYHARVFCDLECRAKFQSESWVDVGIIKTGPENPRWKGGYDGEYGPNWGEQRLKCLKRDGFECQDCGLTGDESIEQYGRLPDVHHIRPMSWFKSEYDDPDWYERGNAVDNLVTLCQPCHTVWERMSPLRPSD